MMLFTRMTRRDRDKGPQTDFVEERELSQINRELLGMTIEDIDLTKEKISILRRGDEEDE